MPNPNIIGGGRLTKGDMSGDRRKLDGAKLPQKYILRRLWRYLSPHKLLITLSILLVVSSNILALLGPSLSGKAVDAIGVNAGGVDFPKVFYYCALVAVCYAASAALSYTLSLVTTKLSRRVAYKLRDDVFNKLELLPVGFFDKHQTGDIISVISYDIDTVNSSLSNDLLQIVKSAITVFGSLAMMITIAPKLLLVFVFTVPLSVVFTKQLTTRVRPLFKRRSAKLGELNGFVEETINGQKTTKAYGCEKEFIDRFDKKNDEAVEAYTKSEYWGSVTGPCVNFINNFSLALVSVFGGLLYLGGGIGLGDISAFVLYSRKFSGPINETANIIGELQSAFAAAERVFRLIDEAPEKPDAELASVLDSVYGDVLIDKINFSYVPGKEIIKDFSLKADRGSLIAIVGPTGAGKTTVINLLMRFYDVDSGDISVDENSIYSVTRESLRKAFSMVLQDTWLFHGTIYENIAYGRENVTEEEVVRAAKAARIHGYIESLPNGYNTVLSDNAVNISKGQKQLLTIARAMLLDSKMLILDEATSNVDTRTERRIQAAMLELMKDKTCFVIAHRLSTVQHADRILVVNNGSIVEQGTHEELTAANGFYTALYASQFETY